MALSLTHDVDQVRKYTLYRLRREFFHPRPRFLRRTLRSLARRARRSSSGEDPYWTFSQIQEMEARHSAKSAFYFGTVADGRGLEYFLERTPPLQEVVCELSRRGFEIGLHAHSDTSLDLQAMRSDKERLDRFLPQPSEGVRQHDLRFHPPQTWRLQAEAQFAYDSTCGFADRPGFRSGTALPYRPLPDQDEFWEVPMHVMDATFRSYMHLDDKSTWTQVLQLINEVQHVGGLLVVNWHNNTFDREERDPFVDVYDRLLSEGSRRSASFLLPREAISRWRACSSLSISHAQRSHDGWTVQIQAPNGADHVILETHLEQSERETMATVAPGEVAALTISE